MFEEEAEEYNQKVPFNPLNVEKEIRRAFQKGAEFGYNKAKIEVEDSYRESLCNAELNLASVTEQLEELEKANKWHKVADGDLPPKELEEKQLLVRVRNYTEDYFLAYYMLDMYYRKNGKRFYFDNDCDYPINIKNIIAWKEIVPPELEESE